MGAPKTQGKRYTEDENEIIRRLLPELGALGVQIYLPHRPVQSIQKQAGRMGVRKRETVYRNKGVPLVREKAVSGHPHWPATPGQLLARVA